MDIDCQYADIYYTSISASRNEVVANFAMDKRRLAITRTTCSWRNPISKQ